jgi:hypothetical protein
VLKTVDQKLADPVKTVRYHHRLKTKMEKVATPFQHINPKNVKEKYITDYK